MVQNPTFNLSTGKNECLQGGSNRATCTQQEDVLKVPVYLHINFLVIAFIGNETWYYSINLDIVQDKQIKRYGPVYKWQKFSQLTGNFVTLCIFIELLKKGQIS